MPRRFYSNTDRDGSYDTSRKRPAYLLLLKDIKILGWAMYDWANSAFSTIVISAFLGPYLSHVIKSRGGFELFSTSIEADSVYPFFVSVSVALQLFFLPVIGAITDLQGNRKTILVILASIGSVCTCMLGILDFFCRDVPLEWMLFIDGVLFVLANLFFGASVVLYNSFLSDIAPYWLRDRISSLGWATGYLGGGLALGLCLPLLFFWGQASGVRASFVLAGLWWLIFTLIFPARMLKDTPKGIKAVNFKEAVTIGMKLPFSTLKQMRKKRPDALRFLLAYFFYNDGVQTVIAVASIFAVSTLKIKEDILLFLILFVQFIAVFGSVAFGWLGERLGTKRAIIFSLLGWIIILFYAFGALNDLKGLFLLAFFIALVLGGTQALSRSLFSQLVPASSQAEYFGFYEVSEKGSSWLGPLVFAVTMQLSGNSRIALASISVFFVIGMALLVRVKLVEDNRAESV